MAWFDIVGGLARGLGQAAQTGISEIDLRKKEQERKNAIIQSKFGAAPLDATYSDASKQLLINAGVDPSMFQPSKTGTGWSRVPTLGEKADIAKLEDIEQTRKNEKAADEYLQQYASEHPEHKAVIELARRSPNAATAAVQFLTTMGKPPTPGKTAAETLSDQATLAALQVGLGTKPVSEWTREDAAQVSKRMNENYAASPQGQRTEASINNMIAALGGIRARSGQAEISLQDAQLNSNAIGRAVSTDPTPTGIYGTMMQHLSISQPTGADTKTRAQAFRNLQKALDTNDPVKYQRVFREELLKGQSQQFKNETIARNTLIDSMNRVTDIIQKIESNKDLKARVGPISGSLTTLETKLSGTGIPELVTLRSELTTALQAYRAAITGKAFSSAEGQEYINLLPDGRLVEKPDLMLDKVNAFRSIAANNQNTAWATLLGYQSGNNPELQSMGLYTNPTYAGKIAIARQAMSNVKPR